MIAQVLHSDDTDFLNYLSKKYLAEAIRAHKNLFIEIRNVPEKIFNESELFLEEFKRTRTLFYSQQSDEKFDLIFILNSLSTFSNHLNELILIKNNNLASEIIGAIDNYYRVSEYKIGNKLFSFEKPYLMGILNVTPDSFSDGGKYLNHHDAVNRAIEMIDDGADIIDIGGESTRPGSEPVSVEEEQRRVLPVIKEILEKRPDAILSIDTYKSEVAAKALEAGVKIVNDISAFTFDPEIADVCSQYDATAVLMHIKGTPKTMQSNTEYNEIISDIFGFLKRQSDFAVQKGIRNIIIDPGIGFGKSVSDNFKIIKRLRDFKSLGYPILIGVSRKSFIGKTLDLETEKRDLPTAAIEAVSILNSARIIRTHNVKNGKQIIKLLSEII